ncbi:hypothetical protein LLR08_23360 [Rouxiella badensis]|uniref:hypothetical protein n=1 Tax=Rouxiella badensis TaxID=1646377 RepID=UPI001D15C129|nr:hypothetical protein [Rouxiella badensis]MCC3705482.1 hypothetical protein [Rouxiella badensis]
MHTVILFYSILAVFVVAAAILPRYFYRQGFIDGIAGEFLAMLTMLLVSGFLLKGTKTALSDLDPLLSTLLVFVLLSTLDCGYLLFKASKNPQ